MPTLTSHLNLRMEKSLKYCHNCFFILFALLISISSCSTQEKLYKKEFSKGEKKQLGKQFLAAVGAYYNQGIPQETFLIQEGLSHQPNSADLWRELGAPCIKRGFAKKSYEYYGKAVALDAENWQGWRGYLYLYFYRDYEKALLDFKATDLLTPDFVDYPQSTSVYFMRAICYLQMDSYDEAINFFDKHIKEELKAVEKEYLDPRVFLYKGIAYFKKGELATASSIFREGIENENEKNADLWFWLAKAESEQGNLSKALLALDNSEKQYLLGHFNERSYVEEFYQVYLSMIRDFRNELKK